MVVTVDHPTAGAVPLTGVPFKLSETPAIVRTAPPLAGQHQAEILAWLGIKGDASGSPQRGD